MDTWKKCVLSAVKTHVRKIPLFFGGGGLGGGGGGSADFIFMGARIFLEGVPETGTKPLKALRGYRASNRGSKNRQSRL